MDPLSAEIVSSTSQPVQITQAQFDAYNRRYCNVTYRAFTSKLTQLQQGGYLHTAPSDVYDTVVDLLINASFGRVGVEGYAETEAALLALITPFSHSSLWNWPRIISITSTRIPNRTLARIFALSTTRHITCA